MKSAGSVQFYACTTCIAAFFFFVPFTYIFFKLFLDKFAPVALKYI